MKPLSDLQADWPAINRLLDEALELPPADRSAWLAALPAEPAGLKDTVARLLAATGGVETGDFLHTLPKLGSPGQAAAATGAQVGAEVGPWRLLREIGEGGMGSVWLAERADGSLKRQVALKLPRLSWQRGLAERMARERDILATLEHPHIARLYDAGVDTLGRPWLALEYVQGKPIDEHVRDKALDVKQRVQLLLQVCEAVAYAHSRLVIHRDLKPGNILVTEDGQVKLLDFGIAKLTQGEPAGATALTELGGRAFTLDYASPEQVRGEPLTTAGDVYSLGVVAYELLAGARPYKLRRGSAAELEESITGADAAPASARADDAQRRRALRGDLDAILGQALAKLRVQRYATTQAFAQDLQCWLRGEPVRARRDGLGYRLYKLASRYRWQAASAAAVTATLLAATVVSVAQARRADAERRLAQAARDQADHARQSAEAASKDASQRRQEADVQRRVAEAERDRAAQATNAARRQAIRAEREAASAAAVRDYMVELFRTSGRSQADALEARELTASQLLERGLARIDGLSESPAARVELLRVFGEVLAENRRFESALQAYSRAVALSASHFGRDHETTLWIAVAQVRVLIMRSDFDGARRDLPPLIERLRRVAPVSLAMAHALTCSCMAQRQVAPERAVADCEEALRVFDRAEARGLDDSWLAENRSAVWAALGSALREKGELLRAEAALSEAYRRYGSLYGLQAEGALDALGGLLETRFLLGDHRAVVEGTPVLTAGRERFENAGAEVAAAQLRLSRSLAALGRMDEARVAAQRALLARRALSDPIPSPQAISIEVELACQEVLAGRAAAGLAQLQALIARGGLRRRPLMDAHLAAASAADDLGDAPAAARHALAAAAAIGSTDPVAVIGRALWLATAHRAAAVPGLLGGPEAARAGLQRVQPTLHGADRARAAWALARLQLARGDSPAAAATLAPWLQASGGQPARIESLQDLSIRARLFEAAADTATPSEGAETQRWRERALQERRRFQDPDSPAMRRLLDAKSAPERTLRPAGPDPA